MKKNCINTMTDKACTALIVDDVEQNRRILATYLEKDGFKTEMVGDGERGIEKLSTHPIDVVLLDIMMPGINGIDVLTRIRADDTFDNIPIIMVTAIDDINTALNCLRKGACGYITKPFEFGQVKKQLTHCLPGQ